MKQLARCYVWWPNMDHELEQKVKECNNCQMMQKSPAQIPIHPWEWPERPWLRIHIDYAGPFLGKMFLVTVNAHSKWIEADVVDGATSTGTIRKLRQMFATHGIPEIIVSDNGSVFTSKEFQQFAQMNGIKHVTTLPYHPVSNGLAERAVQTIKMGLKKITDGTLEDRLAHFLFQYRLTPHTTTGTSPAELLMGRKPRSTLDFIKLNIADRVCCNQQKQKAEHDRGTVHRSFKIGTPVLVKNFASGPTWLPGMVVKTKGNCSYDVELSDGRIVCRHGDHVRTRTTMMDQTPTLTTDADDPLMDPEVPAVQLPDETPDAANVPSSTPVLQRSTRNRRPPDRYTSWLLELCSFLRGERCNIV